MTLTSYGNSYETWEGGNIVRVHVFRIFYKVLKSLISCSRMYKCFQHLYFSSYVLVDNMHTKCDKTHFHHSLLISFHVCSSAPQEVARTLENQQGRTLR